MTTPNDLYQLTAPVTDDELDSALLEMTGDLDKARVLHSRLPHWMAESAQRELTWRGLVKLASPDAVPGQVTVLDKVFEAHPARSL